jgi:hypothetical protein
MKQYPLSLASVLLLAWSCGGGDAPPLPGAGDPNTGDALGDGDDDDSSDDDSSSDGADDDDGKGPGAHDGICEEFGVFAKPTIPDMLIVLDRSGSMGRGVDRWTPSVNAVQSLSSKFQDAVRFGLMVFPGKPAQECILEDDPETCEACAPGDLFVGVKLNAADEIARSLEGVRPDGGTPTAETLETAIRVIGANQAPGPDDLPTPKYVLLVTDGQPTCPAGGGSVDANASELKQDFDRTVTAIDALNTAGVNTYVVGYDAELDPSLVDALSEFARHGGTNDYHPVQNEDELLAEFKKISDEVVSCSYQLEKEPPDPSYVDVRLDDKQLALNKANGWVLDGTKLTLQGDACATLQDGGTHSLSVQVECEEVVVPEAL